MGAIVNQRHPERVLAVNLADILRITVESPCAPELLRPRIDIGYVKLLVEHADRGSALVD